jgi:uncharacterized protein DUF2752
MTRLPAVSWSPRRVNSILAGLLSAGLLAVVNPNTTHVPLCPLHATTGLWCPLCGSTRATHALLHGEWGTALHDNLLFVAFLPLLLLNWWRWSGQRPVRRPMLPRPVFGGLLVLAIGFGVLRNLPAGAWLAPPA